MNWLWYSRTIKWADWNCWIHWRDTKKIWALSGYSRSEAFTPNNTHTVMSLVDFQHLKMKTCPSTSENKSSSVFSTSQNCNYSDPETPAHPTLPQSHRDHATTTESDILLTMDFPCMLGQKLPHNHFLSGWRKRVAMQFMTRMTETLGSPDVTFCSRYWWPLQAVVCVGWYPRDAIITVNKKCSIYGINDAITVS